MGFRLSRQFSFSAISLVQEEEWADWEEEIQVDPQLYGIYQGILTKTEEKPGYTIHGGKLYFKDRLVLSRNSTRIPLLLKEMHDSHLGGHSRFIRTFKRVANAEMEEEEGSLRRNIQNARGREEGAWFLKFK